MPTDFFREQLRGFCTMDYTHYVVQGTQSTTRPRTAKVPSRNITNNATLLFKCCAQHLKSSGVATPESETTQLVNAHWAEAVVEFWLSGGILLIPLAGIGWLVWLRYFEARAEFRSALAVPDSFSKELERRWKQ